MGNLSLGKATFVLYKKIYLVQYAIFHDMSLNRKVMLTQKSQFYD